ncbi:prostatic acid phosphatase, partial [Exaiptasia diaphana]|uniref:acid phosphatase n=1 Tax=Exaiptasia diaphana TaxID=2652724 RepID=A0A913WW62_EXADI
MGWSFHTEDISRLSSGPLLGEMIEHMKSYKKAKAKDSINKAYLYSAHDTTVTGLLSVLGLFDGHSPPYSSAVLVELYSSDTPG